MNRSWFLVLGALLMCGVFVAGVMVSSTGVGSRAPKKDPGSAHTPDAAPSSAQPDALVASEGEEAAPSDLAAEQEPKAADPDPQHGAGLPPIESLDLHAKVIEGDRYVIKLDDGRKVVLTLDPGLQQEMEGLLARYELPHGAVVALEPKTGRILALVSHEEGAPTLGNVALDASAPSASIFKMVTSAALLEDADLDPKGKHCYTPTDKLPTEDIIRNKGERPTCSDLGTAFGLSDNGYFSSIAFKRLEARHLQSWSARFGYNEQLPLAPGLQPQPSQSKVPENPISRAQMAAGFRDTTLSPIHGAMMAGTVANGGVMMRPSLIERVEDPDGQPLYEFKAVPWRQVMKPQTARQMAELMVYTTTTGTARSHFEGDKTYPDDFPAAGKTGTLGSKTSDTTYNWFVGFAPLERPTIAIAVLLHNPPKWHIKAHYAASRAFQWRHNQDLARKKMTDPPDAQAKLGAQGQGADPDKADDKADAKVGAKAPAKGPKQGKAPKGKASKKDKPKPKNSKSDPGSPPRILQTSGDGLGG